MTKEQEQYLLNNILVFDIDGTLAKYEFPNYRTKCFEYKEWALNSMLDGDMYKDAIPTSLFKDIIEKHESKELYILGTCLTSFEASSKIKFLQKHYPNIPQENIIFVGSNDLKYVILEGLYQNLMPEDKNIIMIEDNPNIMGDIETKKHPNIKCMLISDFL